MLKICLHYRSQCILLAYSNFRLRLNFLLKQVFLFCSQVAENIKEFFHNEGIHSTTIQPEFTDYGQIGGEPTVHDHCALACPKGPTQESSACEASKCCPLPNGNGNGNGKESAKSLHNTPVVERRANSFVMAKNVRTQILIFSCITIA